jgi:hypothetical protein
MLDRSTAVVAVLQAVLAIADEACSSDVERLHQCWMRAS